MTEVLQIPVAENNIPSPGDVADINNDVDGDTKTRFARPTIPAPQRSLRMNSKLIQLKPGGGVTKTLSIRPGGRTKRPLQFAVQSSRRTRMKKVGIRKNYTFEQLLSVRQFFKALPPGIGTIEDVFEEGIGELVGKDLETILSRKTDTKDVKEKQPSQDKENVPEKTDGPKATDHATQETNSQTIQIPQDKNKDRQNETFTKIYGSSSGRDAKSEPEEQPSNEDDRPKLTEKRGKNAYVPRRNVAMDPMQEFTRSIRAILNKITLDNFDTLSGQVVTLYEKEVNKPSQLEKLVELIFEKTIIEPEYGPLYARLCVSLSKHNKKFIYSSPDAPTKETGFRGILLKQCQAEFFKSSDQLTSHVKKNSSSLANLTEEDREYELTQQKKALMGTIKFIGQLYLQELLPSSVMIACLNKMVGASMPTVDDLEGACALLETVGKRLENDARAKSQMKIYYTKLTQLRSDDRHYPPRIRILVRNLLDWKQSGWQKSLGGKTDLKTTEQVRQEFNEQRGQNRQLPKISEAESDMVLRMIETGALVDPGFAKKGDIESLTGAMPITGDSVGAPRSRIRNRHRYETNAPSHKQSGLASDRGNSGQRERQQNRMRLLLPTDNLMQNESEETQTSIEEVKSEEIDEYKLKQLADGPELKKDTLYEWLREYYQNKLPSQQLLRHLTGFQWNPKKLIEWSFRLAVDNGEQERQQTASLWVAMLKEGYFTSKHLADTMSEFFEGYTSELSDAPKLAEYLSQMLAPFFVSGELDLKLVESWLQKDPSMTKPHKRNSKLSIQLELIGELFGAIRKYEDSDVVVQELVRTSKFDLDKFLKEELRNDFANQFKLQWYF